MKGPPWALASLSAGLLVGCQQSVPARAPIPAIDAAVPGVTETATFALG